MWKTFDTTERVDGGSTGVSPDTQNDLITCLDLIIADQIAKEVIDCTFLSIQVDETTDILIKVKL